MLVREAIKDLFVVIDKTEIKILSAEYPICVLIGAGPICNNGEVFSFWKVVGH